MERVRYGLRAARENVNHGFNPCKAYISKKRGRGLLGVQSDAPRLLEQTATIVGGDNLVKKLTALWAHPPKEMRRLIQEQLHYPAHQEAGESGRDHPCDLAAPYAWQCSCALQKCTLSVPCECAGGVRCADDQQLAARCAVMRLAACRWMSPSQLKKKIGCMFFEIK